VPHGQCDGFLRPYSLLSRPENHLTDAYNLQELENAKNDHSDHVEDMGGVRILA
jgi:hypothetical protein